MGGPLYWVGLVPPSVDSALSCANAPGVTWHNHRDLWMYLGAGDGPWLWEIFF